jgi:PAS domain S-box-containing protein
MTEATVPESIINYVVRTQEIVILDDAANQNPFSADWYIRQHHARSILCLPLIKQTRLIGVLYLENNLAPHVFTPTRIALLKLLASQAAICLENTLLYRDLEEREAKIRRLVDSDIMGIFFWNFEGQITEANEAFLRMVEYSREDLVSGRLRWTDLTPAEWRESDERAVSELKATGTVQQFEKEYFRKDGSRVPVLIGGAIFEGSKNEGVAFVLDLSEQKRAEEALRSSEQLARSQVDILTRTLEALSKESVSGRHLEHVLRTIAGQLNAHSVSVWQRNEASGLVDLEFVWESGRLQTNFEAGHPTPGSSPPAKHISLWQQIVRTGKHVLCEDLEQDIHFPFREQLLSRGIVTILVLPMFVAGRVEGLIGIRFTRRRRFRTDEIALVQAIAHQAMLAVQLTRLSEKGREAAVVAERNRMAREVHDTLAQGLTGVIVQLEAAENAISKGLSKRADEHLDRAGELARDGLREARRSVQALRPLALEQNELPTALDDLIKKMTLGTNLRAQFILQGKPRQLPPEWEENILRVGQEVLTNALRYSHADYFAAQLVFAPEEIRLELRDNGCGFDPEGKHEGFGLVGMRERVEGMGGQLTVQSAKGEGTAILIVLPLIDTFQSSEL